MAERVVPGGVLERLAIGDGLTLVQIPSSPFCISVRAALEAGGVPHRVHDTALWDRRPVIALTGGAYYAVPVLVDAGRRPPVVVFEARDEGMDVARYVDDRYGLGLFPAALDGLQDLVVQYVEGTVEDVAFRLDDIYLVPRLPDVVERTMIIRHKERKFGRGCLDQWRAQERELRARLLDVLAPLERMLARRPFLLGDRPTFADYALYGVLGTYTYTGDNAIPEDLPHLTRWYAGLPTVRLDGNAPPGASPGASPPERPLGARAGR